MSAVSAGVSEVLIKYTGKYVKIYFIIKITFRTLCRIIAATKEFMARPRVFC